MPVINRERLPAWFRRPTPLTALQATESILRAGQLHTVCESALCPNRTECFARRTATFMILGNICTRSCGFCAIPNGTPERVRPEEPAEVARAAGELGLKYVVVTSVTRDDLPDEGAGQFAETVRAVRQRIPEGRIEVLTPDFHGRDDLIRTVVDAGPDVFNHNLETVERLQGEVRSGADFGRSLRVLATVKAIAPRMKTKSGMMVGLGESESEILDAAIHLKKVGCDILTIGQYLSPGRGHLPVAEYKTPQFFRELAEKIRSFGFDYVFAGPWVRSSYHAGEVFSLAHSEGTFLS
ncbi:MAG: lipoyl synthase [Candidatus Omnitrophota bacterium]